MARTLHGYLTPLLVVIAVLITAGRGVLAQEEPRLTVRVTDQATKHGIALARVIVSGPTQRVGFTDETGSVAIEDVPPGLYRLSVAKAGYRYTTSRFQLRAGESIAIQAGLVSLVTPRVIGTVTSRTTVSSGVTDYSSESPIRRTNDNMPDALRFDPRVLVGPDGSIGINGQPASATSFTLDGIPLGGPGFDLRRIDSGLFASVGVSQDPVNGRTGGSIDLRSFEPTIALQAAVGARFASNQDSALNALITGSAGNLGVVLSAATHGVNGPLAGQRFVDASGLDYTHSDSGMSGGLLTKLRLGISSTQTLSLTALRSTSRDDATCSNFGALVPCGYGPVAGASSSLGAIGMTYALAAGRLSALFTPYVRSQRYNLDFGTRIVQGLVAPAGGTLESATQGGRLGLVLDGSSATQYALDAQLLDTRLSAMSFDQSQSAKTKIAQTYADLALGARIRVSRALTVRPTLRAVRADAQHDIGAEASVAWNPNRTDAIGLSYVPHRRGVAEAFRSALSSPQSLTFDCATGDALAAGGGDASSDPSTSQLRVSWSHRSRRAQTVVSVFRTHQVDAILPGFVNAAGLPTALIPPGYLDMASAYYRSPFGCGGSAPQLALSDILVRQPVRLPSETVQGFNATASLNIGRSLVLVPSYTATYARADELDARFRAPRSPIVTGFQLPGIPMHRWSLVADYRRPGGGPEVIATLQHVGENNPNGLPPYTLVGGGLTFPLARGSLIVSAYNVTDRYSGAFASSSFERPLATNTGAPVGVLANPLSGRRITIAYALSLGARASSRPVSTTSGLPEEAQRNTVQRYDIGSLPASPPADALQADPGAASCVPEALRDANRILAGLRPYVMALDASSNVMRVPVPHIDGVTMQFVPIAGSYELRFTMNRVATLAIARCGRFSLADPDAATRNAFDTREGLASWQLDLRYRPRYGIVLVQAPNLVIARGSRPALTGVRSTDPFVPIADARCTEGNRAAVATLLRQLRPVLDRGMASSGDAFNVIPHGSGDTRWYAVRLTDPLLFAPFFECAPLAATSHEDLRRRGIDGEPQPLVNFSPRYGWYIVQ